MKEDRRFTNPFRAIDESRAEEERNRFDHSFKQLQRTSSRDTDTSERTLVEPPLLHRQTDSVSSTETLGLRRFNSAGSVASMQSVSQSPTGGSALKKTLKFALPAGVHLLSGEEACAMISDTDCFVIDVRPFADFSASHIKGSINFNIPSTLLKRATFTLQKCLANISLVENVKLSSFLQKPGPKRIVFYDQYEVINGEIPLNLFGSLTKFISDPVSTDLYVVQSGYQAFKIEFPDHVEEDIQAQAQQPALRLPPHSRSLSLANIPSATPISPNLSRFHLPKIPHTPVFKIRHNEEFYDFDNYKVVNDFKHLNMALNHTPPSGVPTWLSDLVKTNFLSLTEKFKSLEIDERKRINDMISTNSVGCGIELGFKNRYKDIFPYEHSRVKLAQTPTYETHGYINANFVSAPRLSQLKYIATQAPMKSTAKDFAKLCNDNDVELIIALTNEFENGMEKCYPYWNDSCFGLLETLKLGEIIVRRLNLTDYGHEVLQIQITNWGDFDVLLNSQQDDLLKLIYLKSVVLNKLGKNENVTVHCSAGCGRTGTFCALDSIINGDMSTGKGSLEGYHQFDPIYEVVESFRNQRISMVQNLRQYLFIYDCLLNYYKNFQGFPGDGFTRLDSLDIVTHFCDKKRD